MQHYRKTSHSVYDIKYHFVFTTKYRKSILRGEVAERVRELIREICRKLDIEILKGHVSKDHVHLLLSVPPNVSPSRVMQAVKGKTSHSMLRDFRTLNRAFWGRHLWSRGYFACTSGNITDEVIQQYIETQSVEPRNDPDFRIEDE
jgi:putative transposase